MSQSRARQFEVDGIDVVLAARIETAHHAHRASLHRSFAIELKPTVGDDYPSVLRQINRVRTPFYCRSIFILLVGEYTGVGATREQFVKTMETAGIKVVFADQVEQALDGGQA